MCCRTRQVAAPCLGAHHAHDPMSATQPDTRPCCPLALSLPQFVSEFCAELSRTKLFLKRRSRAVTDSFWATVDKEREAIRAAACLS